MRWDAVIEFPKMKVGVSTREGRVAGIRYLPLTTDSKDPDNELAERAVRQLERYRLGELLGAGGMALVYRGYDRELARQVAVKLLADNLAGDPSFRQRFLREAQAAARL